MDFVVIQCFSPQSSYFEIIMSLSVCLSPCFYHPEESASTSDKVSVFSFEDYFSKVCYWESYKHICHSWWSHIVGWITCMHRLLWRYGFHWYWHCQSISTISNSSWFSVSFWVLFHSHRHLAIRSVSISITPAIVVSSFSSFLSCLGFSGDIGSCCGCLASYLYLFEITGSGFLWIRSDPHASWP